MSEPQHMQVLPRANAVKASRYGLLHAIKAREILAAEVLLGEIPDWLEWMYLERLLEAIPSLPRRKRQTMVARVEADPMAYVGDLTHHQRQHLACHLADWECAALERAKRRAA